MKNSLLTVCLLLSKIVLAQTLIMSGENYVHLNGPRFSNAKIVFTKAEGDWYTGPNDAHSSLTFFGTYDNRSFRFDIEWAGKGELHVINNEMRHDGLHDGDFIMTLPDKQVYGDGLNAYPSGEQEVKVTVVKMDELNLSATISGNISNNNDVLQMNAIINLHRNQTAQKKLSATYKDCDNTIYDKLYGAEDRSPSECEVKFDHDVKQAIHDALEPVKQQFQTKEWIAENETELKPLFHIGRGSEKRAMEVEYELKMRIADNSAAAQKFQKQMEDMTKQIQSGTPTQADYAKMVEMGRQIKNAAYTNVNVEVNTPGFSITNFKGGAKVSKLPGGEWLVQSYHVQAPTGGGEDNSIDACYILMGNFKQPIVTKLGDGGEQIQSKPTFNPSSHLQVQNLFIKIECDPSLADEVMKTLYMQKLRALLQ